MKNILIIFLVVLYTNTVFSQIEKFRVVNEKGIANMVFATIPIEKGKEGSISLQSSFKSNESIYARCYFAKPFGQYKVRTDAKYVVDVYLDGKFVERKTQGHPEPTWQQVQVYVLNTGDDDFRNLETAILNAENGSHKLKLSIGVERYLKTKEVVNSDGKIVNEKVFTMDYISDGEITLVID